jgi:hypothetical protein
MAFNNFVVINDGTDSLKYKTALRSWGSAPDVPSTARMLLSGKIDITYGPGEVGQWSGELLVPVATQPAGWGNIDDLRTQLQRKVVFQFTDHYGTLYPTAAIKGPFQEQSIQPDWDVDSNDIFVSIKVTAI